MALSLRLPYGAPIRSDDALHRLLNPDTLGLLVIAALAALLGWACANFPADLPVWAPWDFSWPEFVATAVPLFWYGRGLALTPAAERPHGARMASFPVGTALIYTVLQTHFEYAAQHMFFLNRLQHLVMHHLGPFLIALGWPGAVIARGMPLRLRRLA